MFCQGCMYVRMLNGICWVKGEGKIHARMLTGICWIKGEGKNGRW